MNTLVEPVLRINQDYAVSDLKVWPQPASDWLYIELEKGIVKGEIQIYDLQGRQLSSFNKLNGTQFRLPVQELHSGLYIFQILEDGKIIASQKLMIQ